MVDKMINDLIRLMKPFCSLTSDQVKQYVEESIRHLYVLSGKSNDRKNGDAVELSLQEQQWVKWDSQSRIFSKLINELNTRHSYSSDAMSETYEEHARFEMCDKQLKDLQERCKKERDAIWYAMVIL